MPTIQITLLQRILNPMAEVRNVFYIDGTLIGPTEIEATASALYTVFDDHWQAQASLQWQLYGYIWRNVTVAQSQGVEVFYPVVLTGTNASDILPLQTAALVSFRTGTPPPNTGRKYLAGLGESNLTGGMWTGATQTGMLAWGNAILNIGTGAGDDQPIGAARIDPSTGLATGFNEYASAIARSIPATMRSRRPGVGI